MPKIHVRADGAFRQQIKVGRLRQAAAKTLERENAAIHSELTLVITGDDQVRALNAKYRNVDEPTDVLSFGENATGPHFVAAPGEPTYLGDVVISHPRAEAQAKSGQHSVADELVLLVVHGILHLLGYDHATLTEKRRMWAAQTRILRELGVEEIGES
jgi:probable rRNA maturation factor